MLVYQSVGLRPIISKVHIATHVAMFAKICQVITPLLGVGSRYYTAIFYNLGSHRPIHLASSNSHILQLALNYSRLFKHRSFYTLIQL